MDKKLRTAWTVAAVLAVLLVIMTVMWGRASGTFTLGAEDLAAQREKISEACGNADDLDTPACRDALDDLARLLGRFERKLEREQEADGSASSTVEIAP
jgi:hypothetical protein